MPLTPRYVRHHTVAYVAQPSSDAMKRIFSKIVEGALAINGNADIMALAKPIVESSVEIYFSVLNELKPIPAKAHYTFNLRDVSKIVQGVLMMRPNQIPNKETLAMLWAHEALRVFSDRLIDDDDRKYFGGMVVDSLKVQFKMSKSLARALRTSFAPSKSSSSATIRRWACRETITRKSLRSTTAQVAVAGSSHLAAGGSGAVKRSTSRS